MCVLATKNEVNSLVAFIIIIIIISYRNYHGEGDGIKISFVNFVSLSLTTANKSTNKKKGRPKTVAPDRPRIEFHRVRKPVKTRT